MNPSEIKAITESLLFAAGTPVALRRLAEVIGVAQAEVRAVITLLMQEYAAAERGVRLVEVAGGYQFRTAAEYADYVKKFVQEKPSKLSRAALETLAIIYAGRAAPCRTTGHAGHADGRQRTADDRVGGSDQAECVGARELVRRLRSDAHHKHRQQRHLQLTGDSHWVAPTL